MGASVHRVQPYLSTGHVHDLMPAWTPCQQAKHPLLCCSTVLSWRHALGRIQSCTCRAFCRLIIPLLRLQLLQLLQLVASCDWRPQECWWVPVHAETR